MPTVEKCNYNNRSYNCLWGILLLHCCGTSKLEKIINDLYFLFAFSRCSLYKVLYEITFWWLCVYMKKSINFLLGVWMMRHSFYDFKIKFDKFLFLIESETIKGCLIFCIVFWVLSPFLLFLIIFQTIFNPLMDTHK